MTVRWEKMDAKSYKKQLAKIAKINQAKMKMKAALILQFARQNANILQDFFLNKKGEMVACGVCVVRCLQKSFMYFSFCLFRHFNLTLSITKLAMHLDREMALPALMIFVCIQKLISQRHITLCF